MLALRMRPYGVSSPYDFFSAARDYALTDEMIAQISTPMLVTDPDNEQFWPGQSRELVRQAARGDEGDRSRSPRRRGPTRTASPPRPGMRGERIFDWLDEQVPA